MLVGNSCFLVGSRGLFDIFKIASLPYFVSFGVLVVS